jgi:hypothetical protein
MVPGDQFSQDSAEVRAKWGVPAGRPGTPSACNSPIHELTHFWVGNATDYAQAVLSIAVNGYMNGATLGIDGGWLLEQSQTWS